MQHESARPDPAADLARELLALTAATRSQHDADPFGNPVLSMSQAPLNELLAPILTRMIDAVSQSRARIATAQSAIVTAVTRRRREDARSWMEKHIRDFRRGYEVAGIPLRYSVTIREEP